MKRSLPPAVVLVLATVSSAQQSMEDALRLIYAKLIFANQVTVIEKNISFGSTKLNPTLSDILRLS
jgi:hypothetical protein